MSDAQLLKPNTEPLEECRELFSFWRLREPWHEVKVACRRHKPHDGPHVTYIDGVGWYEWQGASITPSDQGKRRPGRAARSTPT